MAVSYGGHRKQIQCTYLFSVYSPDALLLVYNLCLLILLFSLSCPWWSWAYSLAPSPLAWFVRVLLWDRFAWSTQFRQWAPWYFKNVSPRGNPGVRNNALASVRSSKVQSPIFHPLPMWPLVTSLTCLGCVLPPKTGGYSFSLPWLWVLWRYLSTQRKQTFYKTPNLKSVLSSLCLAWYTVLSVFARLVLLAVSNGGRCFFSAATSLEALKTISD